jgi:hypothetical protein
VSSNYLIHERGNQKVVFRKVNFTSVLFIISLNLFCAVIGIFSYVECAGCFDRKEEFDMSGKYFDTSALKQSEGTCVAESKLWLRPIPISLPLGRAARAANTCVFFHLSFDIHNICFG